MEALTHRTPLITHPPSPAVSSHHSSPSLSASSTVLSSSPSYSSPAQPPQPLWLQRLLASLARFPRVFLCFLILTLVLTACTVAFTVLLYFTQRECHAPHSSVPPVNPPPPSIVCGVGGHDFSSLSAYNFNYSTPPFWYFLTPCSTVSTPLCANLSAQACELYGSTPVDLGPYAQYADNGASTWAVDIPGLVISYRNDNGSPCPASGQPRVTIVRYSCYRQAIVPTLVAFAEAPPCTFNFNVRTQLAC